MAHDGATARSAPPSMLATCRDCGDVVIRVQLSQVRRNRRSGSGWYSFACPMCTRTVSVSAPEHLLSLLVCLGAETIEVEPETIPAQTATSTEPSALTEHDLLALTAALAATDDVVAHAIGD
jgi:hypothetical protein